MTYFDKSKKCYNYWKKKKWWSDLFADDIALLVYTKFSFGKLLNNTYDMGYQKMKWPLKSVNMLH